MRSLKQHSFKLISLFIISFGAVKINAQQVSCVVNGPDVNKLICINQLPYTWNGESYNVAGSYTAYLVSAEGCDSVVTLNLSVVGTGPSTENVSVCASQLPYSWNGQLYNSAGTYSVVLMNSAGCDSFANLSLSVNSVTMSMTNITICSIMLPYSWNGNSYVVPGIYSVTLTNMWGCDSIASLALDVINVYSSTTTTTICNTQLPYAWNGDNYTEPGNYSVTLHSQLGCDSIANLVLRSENKWTGSINSSWEEPGNWSCGAVPNAYTNVIIESGTVILSSNTTINSLMLDPAATLTVATGFTLTIVPIGPL